MSGTAPAKPTQLLRSIGITSFLTICYVLNPKRLVRVGGASAGAAMRGRMNGLALGCQFGDQAGSTLVAMANRGCSHVGGLLAHSALKWGIFIDCNAVIRGGKAHTKRGRVASED